MCHSGPQAWSHQRDMSLPRHTHFPRAAYPLQVAAAPCQSLDCGPHMLIRAGKFSCIPRCRNQSLG